MPLIIAFILTRLVYPTALHLRRFCRIRNLILINEKTFFFRSRIYIKKYSISYLKIPTLYLKRERWWKKKEKTEQMLWKFLDKKVIIKICFGSIFITMLFSFPNLY